MDKKMANKFFAGFIKWIVIPAGMITMGFFFLGPKVGGNAFLTSKVEPVKELIEDGTAGTATGPIDVPEPKGRFFDVEVEIDVTKDDKDKPDSATEKPKKSSYFSPEAGRSYAEIPEGLPETPESTAQSEPASAPDSGW